VVAKDPAGNTVTGTPAVAPAPVGATEPTIALANDTGVSNSDKITQNGELNIDKKDGEISSVVATKKDGSKVTLTLTDGKYTLADGEYSNVEVTTTKNGVETKASLTDVVVDNTAPAAPVATAATNGDGTVSVALPTDAKTGDTVEVTVTPEDKDGAEQTPVTVTLTKGDNGWTSDNTAVIANPTGDTATIAADQVKDTSDVTVVAKDPAGNTVTGTPAVAGSVVTAGEITLPDAVASTADVAETKDNTPTVTGEKATPNTKVMVTFTDSKGATEVVFADVKADGTWEATPTKTTLADGKYGVSAVIVDATTINETIPTQLGTPVSDNTGLIDTTPPAVPTVVLEKTGDVTIKPSTKTDDDTATIDVSYTDNTGAEQTVTIVKAENGNWAVKAGATTPTGFSVAENGTVTINVANIDTAQETTAIAKDAVGNPAETQTLAGRAVIKQVENETEFEEGTNATFVVTMTNDNGGDVGVHFYSAVGENKNGDRGEPTIAEGVGVTMRVDEAMNASNDSYAGRNFIITVPKGVTTFTFSVPIIDDGITENTEQLGVYLFFFKCYDCDNKPISGTYTDKDVDIKDAGKIIVVLETDSVGAGTAGTSSDGITNQGNVKVSGLMKAADTNMIKWQYSTDGGTTWSDPQNSNMQGTGSFTLPENTAQQGVEYNVVVRQVTVTKDTVTGEDDINQLKISAPLTVKYDTVDPDISHSLVNLVNGNFELTATTEANASVAITGATSGVTAGTADADGKLKVNLGQANSYTKGSTIEVKLTATDIAGNVADAVPYSFTAFGNMGVDSDSTLDMLRNKLTSGNDIIYATGFTSNGYIWGPGADIDFGNGDDTLALTNGGLSVSNLYTPPKVLMGAGNDFASIEYIRGGAYLDMGADDDRVVLNNNIFGTDRSIADGSKLYMGTGDDYLEMYGVVYGGSSLADGGDGYDRLVINTKTMTDVNDNLRGVEDRIQDMQYIKNFEEIDLSQSGKDTLSVRISDVIANGNTSTLIDGVSYTALFVKGDSDDKVDLGANGTTWNGQPNLGDFKQYTGTTPAGYTGYWDGNDDTSLIFIQNGIQII
ncbi:MAG: Ig-like domain-containing protein, partial [Moraxella sp.]|nr:Ig-like domain-containing protein [Moraxella sp.]